MYFEAVNKTNTTYTYISPFVDHEVISENNIFTKNNHNDHDDQIPTDNSSDTNSTDDVQMKNQLSYIE